MKHRLPPNPLWILVLAACGSTEGTRKKPEPFRADQLIQVVYNQYRGPNSILVMENLSGRDEVQLRSRLLQPGEPAVSYVPDDVMTEMLRQFDKGDYYEYARPRPSNPPALGASAELTITDATGRRLTFLRIKAPQGMAPTREQTEAAKAHNFCARTFLAVWEQFRPRMQATSSTHPFEGPHRKEQR